MVGLAIGICRPVIYGIRPMLKISENRMRTIWQFLDRSRLAKNSQVDSPHAS